MFIGHFAIGLGAKKFAPEVSLGTFFIAVQFLDLLWPTLLLLNVEHVAIHPKLESSKIVEFTDYPISHSLLLAVVWSLLFSGVYWLFKRDFKVAIILAFCVLSHWLLDLTVHFPDLPLYPGKSPLLGLGLWKSTVGTIIIEGTIFIIGIILYLKATTTKNKTGIIVFYILIALLIFTHVSSLFAPAPASTNQLAWAAQFQWVFILLAYWADRNRSATTDGTKHTR